ncbi:UHRF1-binding protein 1-like isoform X8 [Polistes fuscatus]|uniref:UHRF1-binding protein 1-like isoform X8 n=2 Tax=Polistes fuscatus TaxID=30207 RepID=UPI001CA9694E|nr:UHRF1-binding protein 1-like isoform X8 [Polistes fuscatus]
MVSIIKNQLLKHLSRFTKNLSADKINLSTFKGEGELTNLELDEIVLTDLLELPSWLRLTSAWCNKVSFRIQWTKLKSVPILLKLDEVHIEVETCEDLRNMSSNQGLSSYAGPTKYSLIHKVIDGITVNVNTVSVTFKSPAFIASVQMNRIVVESKSATWQRCDLRTTRLKDPDRGQLLIFKELEWQTVRIEAQSTKDTNLTPLRLLTNQARCLITIKKRISDCFIMGSRLILILDDLLWVLTDSQLKAALHFIDSLGGLIEKATMLERKTKAARKLEVLPEYQAQISQQSRTKNQFNTPISKLFSKYDVVETSYHFWPQRIDLHLCDDVGGGRSLHPDLRDGGALQISLVKFYIDYYPYHLAMADRKDWVKYRENATPHSQWLQQSLSSFRSQFMDLIDSGRTQHSPLTRSQGNVTGSATKGSGESLEKSSQSQSANVGSQEQKKFQGSSGNPVKNYVLEQLAKLMTTCIIIRIDDFTLFKVTTASRKPVPKEFITAQTRKKRLSGTDNIRSAPSNFTSNSVNELIRQLHREFLWTEAKDVWCCNLEPVWGDFFGARAVGQNRPVPFFDAFPLTFWCHMNLEPVTETKNTFTADIHGLAYISNLVSVQINHYQYLFLLRLSEVLSELTTYLAIDSNKILNVESGGSLIIGALIPQIEVTFVMPSHTPGKENSGGDLESVVPDSSSIADDFAGSSSAWHNSTQVSAKVDFSIKKMNTSNDVETPQSEVSSMSMDFTHPVVIEQPIVTFKQNGNPDKREHIHTNIAHEKPHTITEEEGLSLKQGGDAIQKHNKPDLIPNTPFIQNNFNVGLSSMRKGFSNLMTSIDSALKASPEDGSSDTVSMRSDLSSDSENYALITLQDQEKSDGIFAVDNSIRITAVEEASEVVEETPDTQSEKSVDSVCKRKDIISVTTFKLSKVEFITQSSGYSSTIKVQVSNVKNDECPSIPWDEFQVKRKTKFSSRSRGWTELPSDSDCRTCIKLRLDHDLKNKEDSLKLFQASQSIKSTNNSLEDNKIIKEQANNINLLDKQSIMDLFEDKLEINVTDVTMTLSMSSVTGLADLAEDEIIPKPIPMQVYLERIFLHLNEDRPPNNITSPGPIPIQLNISKLRIGRDLSGAFNIEPIVTILDKSNSHKLNPSGNNQISKDEEREIELNSLRQTSKQLKSDNEELKRRLGTLERLSEENAKLLRIKEESDMIKTHYNSAQENIALLIKEKQVLRETITELQNQIMGNGPGGSNRTSWSIKR